MNKKRLDKKKLAAAMAAVTAYITTGQTAPVGQDSASLEIIPQGQTIAPQMNLWGITGRQALMQSSTMMQMRLFK